MLESDIGVLAWVSDMAPVRTTETPRPSQQDPAARQGHFDVPASGCASRRSMRTEGPGVAPAVQSEVNGARFRGSRRIEQQISTLAG